MRRVSTIDRFWSRVSRGEDSDCWEWTHYTTSAGYGRFVVTIAPNRSVFMLAHRFAWELHNGPAFDLCVLHRCDNPPCVNPGHLFLGTRADNNHDRNEKGRNGASSGDNHWTKTKPQLVRSGDDYWRDRDREQACARQRGERNVSAKLTADLVVELRRRYGSGEKLVPLAREFGIATSTAWSVITRDTWPHVA